MSKTKKNTTEGFISNFSDIIDELQKENKDKSQRHTLHIKDKMDQFNIPLKEQLSLIQEAVKCKDEIPEHKRVPLENLVMVIRDELEAANRPVNTVPFSPGSDDDHSYDVTQ